MHVSFMVETRSNTISPDTPNINSVRTPAVATWLENVALRDLALHLKHAACVDVRGDVYQWGDGFIGCKSQQNANPVLTLRGKVYACPALYLVFNPLTSRYIVVEYHTTATYRVSLVCTLGLWETVYTFYGYFSAEIIKEHACLC